MGESDLDPWEAITAVAASATKRVKHKAAQPALVGPVAQPKPIGMEVATAPPYEFDHPRARVMEVMPPPPDRKRLPHGVYRHGKRFRVAIKIGNKSTHIGVYDTPEEAHAEYVRRGGWQDKGFEPVGNGAFEPTESQRIMVQELALWGLSAEKIAIHIIDPKTGAGVSHQTIKEHFPEELGHGTNAGDRATLNAMDVHLHGRAPVFWTDPETGHYLLDKTGKPIVLRQELRPNVAAAIFMTKIRPGIAFRETQVIEHTRPIVDEVYERLKNVPRERLLQVRDALRRAVDEAPDGDAEGS